MLSKGILKDVQVLFLSSKACVLRCSVMSDSADSTLLYCTLLMDCSPPGSFVHGILQARILEWVIIPFSREWSRPRIEPWSGKSLPPDIRGTLQLLDEYGNFSSPFLLTNTTV